MNDKLDLRERVSLAPFTTLGIGGPARYFVRAETETAVLRALEFADHKSLDLFVLGGGSNVLVADAGFDGLVLQVALSGVEIERAGKTVIVRARAGDDWDELVSHCTKLGLAGLECLSGIPGLVGGTPVQNVGAYGQEVSETVREVRCLDVRARRVVRLTNDECGFRYRTSIFNSSERDRYIVLDVTFELEPAAPAKVAYKDLVEHFDGHRPSIAEVRDAVLAIRRSKSMVIESGDPNSKSAGSFFKNPVVSGEILSELRNRHGPVPNFEFEGQLKVPAAWLIEKAGFHKGHIHGNVGISTNHTLALINRGGGTASEIIELKDEIAAAVRGAFGIELFPEPVFVGF